MKDLAIGAIMATRFKRKETWTPLALITASLPSDETAKINEAITNINAVLEKDRIFHGHDIMTALKPIFEYNENYAKEGRAPFRAHIEIHNLLPEYQKKYAPLACILTSLLEQVKPPKALQVVEKVLIGQIKELINTLHSRADAFENTAKATQLIDDVSSLNADQATKDSEQAEKYLDETIKKMKNTCIIYLTTKW